MVGAAVVDEEREEGKPVVASGLEANDGLAFVKWGGRFRQRLKAFALLNRAALRKPGLTLGYGLGVPRRRRAFPTNLEVVYHPW